MGPQGGTTAWFNFFIKPLGASSFAGFWRAWNPVYGYFLYYYSYRPLAVFLPRAAAMLFTFVVCGFVLHDLPAWALTTRVLPPGATIVFILFGLGAVLGEAFHMDLSRYPLLARAGFNIVYRTSSTTGSRALVAIRCAISFGCSSFAPSTTRIRQSRPR